jgi:hypothetical protein
MEVKKETKKEEKKPGTNTRARKEGRKARKKGKERRKKKTEKRKEERERKERKRASRLAVFIRPLRYYKGSYYNSLCLSKRNLQLPVYLRRQWHCHES